MACFVSLCALSFYCGPVVNMLFVSGMFTEYSSKYGIGVVMLVLSLPLYSFRVPTMPSSFQRQFFLNFVAHNLKFWSEHKL